MAEPLASPFPGMDPFLEHPRWWPDFHSRMLASIADQLLDRMPDAYDAVMEDRVRLVEMPSDREGGSRQRVPDVVVSAPRSGSGDAAAATATLDPPTATVDVPLLETEEVERWIEIVHGPDREAVTVIELLSPTNKTGEGFFDYQRKRYGLIHQRVHLLELDLLVGGQRPDPAEKLPPAAYYGYLTRSENKHRREVYAWGLRDGLPTLPVPLRAPDPDVPLDLAAAFAEAYERGRYRRRLRREALPDALGEADAVWARERVAHET